MYRLTIRQLWAHKLRFALTGLAVVLGVAFLTGTTVLTDTMGATFGDLFAKANSKVDVVLQQPSTIRTDIGDVRSRVPADVLDRVRSVDGVAVAAGKIDGFTQLVKADGTVAAPGGLGMTVGANWVDERLNPFTLASGRPPQAPEEAVIDVATAEREGWKPGDRFKVLTAVGPQELDLVGTVTLGDLDGLPGSTVVATTDATAQRLFAKPGEYDGVIVAGTAGTTPTDLAASIDRATGGSYEVLTGEEDTAATQQRFEEDLAFVDQFLSAFAYVSLFVGVFIIYNTFSIVVAQRKKDMAMLRAIGASRRQVLGAIVFESFLVGAVASCIGLAGGLGMSIGLRALLGAVGLDIPDGSLVVTAPTVVTAFVIGTTVTALSALAPALRASRVRPIAALRDVATDRSSGSLPRTVVGFLVTAAGVAVFVGGTEAEDAAMQLLGLGAITVVLGLLVLGPVLARPVLAVVGRPAPLVSGAVGRLAQQNARRNPRRTAATASALMIGVALVGFITILAASTERSVENAVDRTMRADYVVDSGAFGRGGFDPSLAERIAADPAVAQVSPLRMTPASIDGTDTGLHAVDMSSIDEMFDLDVTSGSFADTGDGDLAVKESVAEEKGWKLGDRVDVEFPAGKTALTVTALYRDDPVGTGGVDHLIDLTTYDDHVADHFDQSIFVVASDRTPPAEARRAVESAVAGYPNATVQDQDEFKQGITDEIGRLLNLIYGLLALAVAIALIGIANTLALSVHERTREIGLLRAIGMTRRQLRSAIRWESVQIAMLGTCTGAILAVAGAWGIVEALRSEGVTTLVLPAGQLTVVIVLATFAGVVAALGPARRAARLDVLDAISTT